MAHKIKLGKTVEKKSEKNEKEETENTCGILNNF